MSIDFYRDYFNLQDATFMLIEHDDAFVAIVYKVELPKGPHYILKICLRPCHCQRENYFLTHFKNQLPVPNIIGVCKEKDHFQAAILMEYLPGEPLKTQDIDKNIAYDAGHLLARIHQNRISEYRDLIDQNNSTTDPKPSFLAKFEEGLNECEEQVPKDLIEKSRSYLKSRLHLLDKVDGPCITHLDFRPGNILMRNKKIIGIIDWSGARASFAEEDFCLLEHSGWEIDNEKKKAFLSGYSSIRTVPNYSPIMPMLSLHKAIAIMGFAIREKTWKNRDHVIYQKNLEFLKTLI